MMDSQMTQIVKSGNNEKTIKSIMLHGQGKNLF